MTSRAILMKPTGAIQKSNIQQLSFSASSLFDVIQGEPHKTIRKKMNFRLSWHSLSPHLRPNDMPPLLKPTDSNNSNLFLLGLLPLLPSYQSSFLVIHMSTNKCMFSTRHLVLIRPEGEGSFQGTREPLADGTSLIHFLVN